MKKYYLLSVIPAILLIQASCKDLWHPDGPTPKPTKPVAEIYYNNILKEQNDTIDVGEILTTHSKKISVEIRNTGTDILTIDTANITITGVNASAFNILTNPGDNIAEQGQSSFSIECKPTQPGVNNATLAIPTNDKSRSQIVIYLRATVVKGSAVLKLSQSGTDITTYNFERVAFEESKSVVFTIENTGNIALELTGNPAVESSNAVFAIQTQPTNKTIGPNDVSFTIRYTPTDEKEDNGTITIRNNSDNPVFTFNVKGTGYKRKPQITVKQGSTLINQNGAFDFDSVGIGENKDITFTIENAGEANLNITSVNDSRVNLEDNTDGGFSIIQQPSVVVIPKNSTNFIVRFSPTTEDNNFTATVYIKTDSKDNEDFYFMLKGTGYIKRPQITVKQGNTPVNSNGEYDFTSILAGKTKDIIFTIENTGEANLDFVSVNGNNANLENNDSNYFSIIQQPLAVTVAPKDTTTFTIRFNPTIIGNNYSATVKIITNSQNNNEFSFRVKGNGRNLAIGDTGPGGGWIFFVGGGQYKECSAELGSYPWAEAKTAAQNHKGGGFTNWHLPDRGELSLMQQNLYMKRWGVFSDDYYWSSEEYSSDNAWGLHFYSSQGSNYPKTRAYRVRAVRTFSE